MAIVVYPLNNIDFTAEDAAIYNSTRTSGIYAGDDFAISLTGTDNTISIDVGLAWMRLSRFQGVAAAVKEKAYVDMGLPDATYPRIDALVLQFDANKNGAELVSKQGTASSAPKAPAVSRTEALYELHLLHVLRGPGAASITAADVTDLRMNSAYCGLMADSVTRVDTAAINAQVSALIQKLRDDLARVEDQTYYAPKSYVDAAKQDAKDYADGKHLKFNVQLSADWSGAEAPYSQTVPVPGIMETDRPHYGVVYSGDNDAVRAQRDAFACIDDLDTYNNSVTFTCFDDKPAIALEIQMEVNR